MGEEGYSNGVNHGSKGGISALRDAVRTGRLDTVKHLRVLGAHVNATTKRGYNVLHCAAYCGRDAMVRWVLDQEDFSHSVNMKTMAEGHPLSRAVCKGHASTVKLLMDGKANITAAVEGRKTLFDSAFLSRRYDIVALPTKCDDSELIA